MPSLIPGFEYDIFISYRHKDNKGGHWVTEFINALKTELDATFKEDISVYFDENPHDGLLETHNVDKSLEGKLKCLILIPILSQTYCDPKSFAWQHEFCAFNKMAREDQFGRDIKLSNGNVTSRILPLKIHDLDEDDRILLENELGGVVRAIEFIFRSAGVNRPLLTHEEHPHDNLSKTFYRDQVNKVANAIKEIISALRHPVATRPRTYNPGASDQSLARRPGRIRKTVAAVALLILVGIAGYFVYPKLFSSPEERMEIDRSIAVLPFTDISEAHDQAYFSDGMMIEILDHLFKIKDLRIISRNSTLGYKDSTRPLKEIGGELGVGHLIQGSVRRVGSRVKISVALVEASTEKYLWQHTYEDDIAEVSRVFAIQSDVASQIANVLKAQIAPEVQKRMDAIPTQNQEAYDLFLKGRQEYLNFWSDLNTGHTQAGIAYLNKAISLDGNFSDAFAALGECYWFLAEYAHEYTLDYWRQSKEYLNKAIALDPQNGWAYSLLAVNQFHGDWDKKTAFHSFKKALELNPSDNSINSNMLWFYLHLQHCDSIKIMLDKMKELEPGYYYGYEVAIRICGHMDEELQAIKPPAKFTSFATLLFEMQRLIILEKYDDALSKMDLYETLTSEDIFLEMKGELLGAMGKNSEALEVMKKLEALAKTRHVWPSRFAMIYMAMGDEKKAYEYLELGIRERGLWLHVLPYYAPFYKKRNDPRFQAFMKRTWIN